MTSDDVLRGLLRGLLLDPEVARNLAEAQRPVLREEVRAALQDHATDRYVDLRRAAEHCGLSYAAMKQRLAVDSDLQVIRQGRGRLTRFRVTDLDIWLANRQSRTRATK